MTRSRLLKVMAFALFVLGFAMAFAASDWRGATLMEHPLTLAATLTLWILGIALEWRADALEHSDHATPLWRRICAFIGRGSATWLLLGILFGFVYSPTISTTYFGTNFNAILAITLAVMGVQISLDAWRQLARDVRPVFL
ncbi:MAG: hypothetical protein LBE59_08305, partial [Nevskiaceae bacterium]|nr:hypothetical protein [Nevskiaceae bacterium]